MRNKSPWKNLINSSSVVCNSQNSIVFRPRKMLSFFSFCWPVMKFTTLILWIFMSEELLASYHTNGKSRGQYPNVFNTAKGALLKLLHGKLWTPRFFFLFVWKTPVKSQFVKLWTKRIWCEFRIRKLTKIPIFIQKSKFSTNL